MGAESLQAARQRLDQALALLEATPLPPELVDNPAYTNQWLATVGNLRQALLLLWVPPVGRSPSQLLGQLPGQPQDKAAHSAFTALSIPEIGESRADRVVRRFNRMIDGLPLHCLKGMSPVSKLGLLQPLLRDLETGRQRWTAVLALPEMLPLNGLLHQYAAAIAGMAARYVAPDPPLRPPETIPAMD